MIGAYRAELLRLRKRTPLLIIAFGVPALIAASFILGFSSLYEQPPFNAEATRQEAIDFGYVVGAPPEEAERLLDEYVEQSRQGWAQNEESLTSARATFAFPYSLATVVSNAVLLMIAMILLTATTIGDEFGWGTLRTSLLASSKRSRFLFVRLTTLIAAALLILAIVLLLGFVLPIMLNVAGGHLPAQLPAFDTGAFLVLVGGELVAVLAVTAFAAFVTLLVRHGAVTLIVALVWFAVEAAILTVLSRFESFQDNGPDKWILDVFPLHGLTTLIGDATRAATGIVSYSNEPVSRTLDHVATPIASYAVLAVLFTLLAFRRFQRMDIVE